MSITRDEIERYVQEDISGGYLGPGRTAADRGRSGHGSSGRYVVRRVPGGRRALSRDAGGDRGDVRRFGSLGLVAAPLAGGHAVPGRCQCGATACGPGTAGWAMGDARGPLDRRRFAVRIRRPARPLAPRQSSALSKRRIGVVWLGSSHEVRVASPQSLPLGARCTRPQDPNI